MMPEPEQNQYFSDLVDRISSAWSGLADKPDETPESTVRTLWQLAAGNPVPPAQTIPQTLPRLTAGQSQALLVWIDKRLSGIPLAYLTGRQDFMGVTLLCTPQAMIPRKETEILGAAALATAHRLAEQRGAIRTVDLCTGSGNLALVLAAREPRCQVWGADIAAGAVDLARHNADFLGLSDRAHFLQGDLFAPFETPEFLLNTDLITCNPPYISSAQVDKLAAEIRAHEPRPAFDGGPFGIQVITRLLREAPRFLKPCSWLCFEVGLGQAKAILQMMRKMSCYPEVVTHCDKQGEIRALCARTAI